MLILHPYTIQDLDIIKDWISSDAAGSQYLESYATPENWIHLVDNKQRFFYIAKLDDASIGFFDFEIQGEKGYFSFYVALEHRGKGLGSKLLQTALSLDTVQQVVVLEGGVAQSNIASQKVLEHLGFRNEGVNDEDMLTFVKNVVSPAVIQLKTIFENNKDKRICVVGASCSGKSTLLKHFPEAIDMDDVLWGNTEKGYKPLLTPEEIAYINSPTWTPEIGNFVDQKAKELITIQLGHPVFGTVVFPADLVVEIVVPDHLLKDRIKARNAKEVDVLAMKAQIEKQIEESGTPKIVVENV